MNTDAELALRQQRLLARSAALRASIAEQAAVLEAPLGVADRIRSAARWAWRERFALVGGTAVVAVLLRPRRVWKFARLGWWVWRRTRHMQAWFSAVGLSFGVAAANSKGPPVGG